MSKSHSTVSKYKQLATQMSNWAMREEICVTNFAHYIKLPENVKKEKEIFTDGDIEKLESNGSDERRSCSCFYRPACASVSYFPCPSHLITRPT